MKTYEIETVNDRTLTVEGNDFSLVEDATTGEFQGYEVQDDEGTTVAFIAPGALISAIVKA